MNRLVSYVVVTTLLAGAAGCSTVSSGGSSTADYGPAPTEDVRALISRHLAKTLKDPNSAQIGAVRGPTRIHLPGGLLGGDTYGWGICVSVNAKNGFGAYTGFNNVVLVYRYGNLSEMINPTDNQFTAARIERACQSIS